MEECKLALGEGVQMAFCEAHVYKHARSTELDRSRKDEVGFLI